MTNKIKTAVCTGLAGLVGLLPMRAKAGNASGHVGYMRSENPQTSYVETSVDYGLPGDVKANTFLDVYNDGGYFGKTTLTRKITNWLNARARAIHGNEYFSQAGIGVEAKIPMPNKMFAKLMFMPLWHDGDAPVKNKANAEYVVGADLGKGFDACAWGRINVADPEGPTWCAGGISLYKHAGKWKIGYDANLNSRGAGDLSSKIEHRLGVFRKF